MIISGKGNYKGSVNVQYVINKADQGLECDALSEFNIDTPAIIEVKYINNVEQDTASYGTDQYFGEVTVKCENEGMLKFDNYQNFDWESVESGNPQEIHLTFAGISTGTSAVTVSVAGDKNHNPVTMDISVKVLGGWIENEIGWRYWHDDGTYSKEQFEVIDSKTYYFSADGYMVTGLQEIEGSKYYFNDEGEMQTGWQTIDGNMYYYKTDGSRLTGWLQKSGKKYYFKTSGQMHTGWLKLSGKYYYFKENGQMVTGRYKIGTKWYTFNSNGVRQ